MQFDSVDAFVLSEAEYELSLIAGLIAIAGRQLSSVLAISHCDGHRGADCVPARFDADQTYRHEIPRIGVVGPSARPALRRYPRA